MWSRKKSKQPNSDRCPHCGHFMHAPGGRGKTWTAQSRPFSMRGENAESLERWPPAPQAVRQKSATRTRIEQSIAVGVAVTLCPASCAISAGYALSLPALGCLTTAVSAGTFVLSVALGADNWATIFRWLDRNKDGRVGADDLRAILDEWAGADGDSAPDAPKLRIERGLMVYGADGHGRLLFPNLPRPQVRRMMRACAVRHLGSELPEDKRDNFTSRYVAKPCSGEYLSYAQAMFAQLGFAIDKGNSTHVLTDAGSRWLSEVLKNA